MHEGHFTEQIIDSIVKEIKKYPNRQVESVTVKVGEVYHLVADSVLMHFELIAKGTALQGVKLNLIEEPMMVLCGQCHKKGPVEDHHLLMCSFCHSREVKAVAGNEVVIEQIAFKKS